MERLYICPSSVKKISDIITTPKGEIFEINLYDHIYKGAQKAKQNQNRIDINLFDILFDKVAQLHKSGWVHCDLSFDNIMCTKSKDPILIDLGRAWNYNIDISVPYKDNLHPQFSKQYKYKDKIYINDKKIKDYSLLAVSFGLPDVYGCLKFIDENNVYETLPNMLKKAVHEFKSMYPQFIHSNIPGIST